MSSRLCETSNLGKKLPVHRAGSAQSCQPRKLWVKLCERITTRQAPMARIPLSAVCANVVRTATATQQKE